MNASMEISPSRVIAAAVAMFCLLLLAPAPTLGAGDTPDSTEVAALLREAEGQAIMLEKEASTMQIYGRSAPAWESDTVVIDQVKEEMSNLLELTKRLDAAQRNASPSQQEAIVPVDQVLKELASNINSTIEHLNQNERYLHTAICIRYVTADSQLAKDAVKLIKDSVEFEEEDTQFKELEQSLEARR